MEYLIIFIVLFLIFGTLAAQAGYSMTFFNNRLQSWQKKIPLGNRIPEFLIGLGFGAIALWGWDHAYELVAQWVKMFPITNLASLFIAGALFSSIFYFAAFVSFVGKESATVFYLPGNWYGWSKDSDGDGDIDEDDARNSSMRPVNDFFAKILRVSIVGRWYPKIWAFTKGLLISIPIACLCAPFSPITRHIGIKIGEYMNKKYGHDTNFYAEYVGDGLSYAAGLTVFIALVREVL